MARKVIPSRIRKHNALKIRSKNRFLLRNKSKVVGTIEKKRSSKVELKKEEVALLKKTFLPLLTPRKVPSKVKEGIEPGRIVILLAGAHKGKHAVVLKVLESGLLLVTGPHKINGLPLRRVHQMFTIVTSMKLDISGVKLDANINDSYFAKKSEKKPRGKKGAKEQEGESNLFSNKKVEYTLTDNRKKDQVTVDKQILGVIKSHPEKSMLVPYLASHFYLKNRQYPHQMKF